MLNIVKRIKVFRFELIALAFTIWGFILRINRLANRNLWVDEVNQLEHTIGPFKPIWQRLRNGEVTAFPGDYILKWPVIHFTGIENKWLVNLLHYPITLLGFYMFYLICKKHIKSTFGFIVAFCLMTIHNDLVFHSFEFRPYAILPTFTLISFYFSDLLINNKTISNLKRFFIYLFLMFFVIVHAFGLMIILLCLFFFLIQRVKEKDFKQVFTKMIMKPMLCFLFFAIPTFIWFATGVSLCNRAHFVAMGIKVFQYFPDPAKGVDYFLDWVIIHLLGFKKYNVTVLLYGVLIAWIIPHKQRLKQIQYMFLFFIIPIGFILISDIQKNYWFVQRQFVWTMPLFAFFIGWCWDSIIIFLKQVNVVIEDKIKQ